MKTTGNLGLKKPEGTDIVDINDLNGNMDILDTAAKAAQDHAADTTKHITAIERSTWNAKAAILDLGIQSPWAAGNGWRQIATSAAGVTKRQATVIIDWSNGTATGQAIFVVSINDNASPEITQIVASSSATNQGLVQARVVYHSTTKGNGASIDVFKAGAAMSNFNVKLVASEGWTPTISSGAAVVPTDYSSLALTFTNGGVATTGQITTTYVEGPPLKVSSPTVVAGLNVEKLGGADLPTVAQGTLTFAVTAGTATTYTATYSVTPVLNPGLRLSFKAHVASSVGGTPTLNPNGLGAKSLVTPDGNPAKLALNGVYTVVYDGASFILQGEGGGINLTGSNAVPSHVLAGKTFYSAGSSSMQTGTMQNYDGMSQAGVLANPGVGAAYATIPSAGFYGTTSEIGLYDADFVSQNIKSGVNIFGVHGTFSGGSMTSERVTNVSAYNFSYNETNVYFTLSAGTTKNWTGKAVAITISGITTEGNSTQNGIQCTDMPDAYIYGSASAFGNVANGGWNYDIATNGGTVRLQINSVDVNPSTIDIACQYTYSGDGSISIVGYPSFNVEIGGLA